MITYNIGPVEGEAYTKTEAREQAVTRAAKILERLNSYPAPIPGPPGSPGEGYPEIVAIVFQPGFDIRWIVQYVMPGRVLTHTSDREIGEVRKEAVEFAAQHNLSCETSELTISKLTTWATDHLVMSGAQSAVFAEDLRQIVLLCKANEQLKNVYLRSGELLTDQQIHAVLCGAPHLEGELLEIYVEHVKSRGIK